MFFLGTMCLYLFWKGKDLVIFFLGPCGLTLLGREGLGVIFHRLYNIYDRTWEGGSFQRNHCQLDFSLLTSGL